MKILLANPATRESIDNRYERFFIKAGSRWPWTSIKEKDEKNTNIFFPFYLAYTANILRNAGHEVFVIDGVAMDMKEKEFLKKVNKFKPDIIVSETSTHAIDQDLELYKKVKSKNPKLRLIMTGAHVTIFAKELLNHFRQLDYIAKGEYELVVCQLVENIKKGIYYPKTEGLGWRNGKEIWVSEKKRFITDINKLPYPAYELFPCNDEPNLKIYDDGICTYFPAVTLHSTRGCPFRCDFCLWNQVMYGNQKQRVFDVKRVVDEMEYVVDKFGAKEIYFDDDDFCATKQHVIDLCNEIIKRGLNKRIKWSCMGDAMVSDEEMIKIMAKAGCIYMKFGVESGNKGILRNICKPLKPEKAIQTAKLCRIYGIYSHATFIFGLDGDTMETMQDTLNLANKIPFDSAQAAIATPFPGTRFYDKLVQRGEIKKNLGWRSFDGTTSCVFDTKYLKAEQIEAFRKKAIKSMILHKLMDPVWDCRFIRRLIILIRERGLKPVITPIKAIYYTFFKK